MGCSYVLVLNNYISIDDNTTVLEVPTDRYIVAAVSGHAKMDDSDDKTEMSTRESESVDTIVTEKRELRISTPLPGILTHRIVLNH
jgi:hypothetical protein